MEGRKNVNTDKIPRSNLAFPQAVAAGGFIFLSGTAGVDPETGKLAENGFEGQARQAFTNVQTILHEAGSSMSKVVKITVLMVGGCDPDFSIINKIYTEFFPVDAPARSAPQLMPFPSGILISVDCIALQ